MKLTIQNGCVHALTRKEMESILPLFPARWNKGVDAIVFYQGKKANIYTEYYKKERILGLFWPKTTQPETDKIKAVEELIVGLECVAENASPSIKMSESERNHFIEKTSSIFEKCLLELKAISETK